MQCEKVLWALSCGKTIVSFVLCESCNLFGTYHISLSPFKKPWNISLFAPIWKSRKLKSQKQGKVLRELYHTNVAACEKVTCFTHLVWVLLFSGRNIFQKLNQNLQHSLEEKQKLANCKEQLPNYKETTKLGGSGWPNCSQSASCRLRFWVVGFFRWLRLRPVVDVVKLGLKKILFLSSQKFNWNF